jgi:hypothetical protein
MCLAERRVEMQFRSLGSMDGGYSTFEVVEEEVDKLRGREGGREGVCVG